MKKILFLALLILPVIAYSQNSKIKEIGLNYGGSNIIGIRYRSGSETTLFRLTLTSASLQHDKSPTDKDNSVSSSIAFNPGIEKRILLSDKSGIYYGADLIFSMYNSKYTQSTYTSKSISFAPGLGVGVGFFHKITDYINISAEIMPSIRYSTSKNSVTNNGVTTKESNSSFLYGLIGNCYSVTLSFRLGK
jgi:hypothetical protein